jgi:hypothetical protein
VRALRQRKSGGAGLARLRRAGGCPLLLPRPLNAAPGSLVQSSTHPHPTPTPPQPPPQGIVYNITGGRDLTLSEVNRVSEVVTALADPAANVIFGAVVDDRWASGGWRELVHGALAR